MKKNILDNQLLLIQNKNLFNNKVKISINKICERKLKDFKILRIISNKGKYLFFLITIFFFSFLIFTVSRYNIIINNKEDIHTNLISFNNTIEMDAVEEMMHIQYYVDLVLKGKHIDKNKLYIPSNKPLISIVISVYNGEAYLKTALLSIQNQNLKNIEIIMVDDCSKDNSRKLIKELMKTEPRIILLENRENRGPLYTKTKGILHAKGKYVMTLDEDDMYCQRDAFSSLFKRIIAQIGEKYLEKKMYYHDDFIMFFLLTRNAYNMKYIDRIFYICLKIWDKNDPKVKFRTDIKENDINNKKCFGFLNFLEMFLEKTRNNYKDKKIAFSQLDTWYLKQNICRDNEVTKGEAVRIFKLYLNNKYITKADKIKIKNFINGKKG